MMFLLPGVSTTLSGDVSTPVFSVTERATAWRTSMIPLAGV